MFYISVVKSIKMFVAATPATITVKTTTPTIPLVQHFYLEFSSLTRNNGDNAVYIVD